MGAVAAAPISAAASCLGGCAAVCCCKVLESGTVSSARAASVVLVWLQIFAVVLAMAARLHPESWLDPTCAQLHRVGLHDVGVCACGAEEHLKNACYVEQLTLRVQAANCAVFIVLLLMTLSCCGACAARFYVVFKFFAVLLIAVVLAFLPNALLNAFGSIASVASAVFLVAQAVFVIDLAYTWNEAWFAKATAARRNPAGGAQQVRKWQASIVGTSLVLMVLAILGAVLQGTTFHQQSAQVVVSVGIVLPFILLLLSITSWCEHGSLLTSAAFMLYSVWLVQETLTHVPDSEASAAQSSYSKDLVVVDLIVCFLTLAGLLVHMSRQAPATTEAAKAAPESRLEEGADESAGAAAPARIGDWRFAVQCFVHAGAALYICAALVPRPSNQTFAARCVALGLAIAFYAWSLVAPKLFPGRSFSRPETQ